MTPISQPCSSSASLQICIVMESNFNHKYEIFLVDFGVDSDGKVAPEELNSKSSLFCVPLNYPSMMSFFALGSRIYFLGGLIRPDLTVSEDVYVYDTSSDKPQIEHIGKMNSGKNYPILVIGPIKEKFYVTSRCLWFGDLEEFNPASNSWKTLCHPPIMGNESHMVKSYVVVVVNKRFKILMSTKSGLFCYDIDQDKWDFHPDESLPFDHVALSVDNKDRDIYLMHTWEEGFHSSCYNHNDRKWDDLQTFKEKLPNRNKSQLFYCMSLGDGRVCAVQSFCENNAASESCNPLIKVARFQAKDGCDFRCLDCHLYKQEPYDAEEYYSKTLKDSFPFRCRIAADVGDQATKKSNKNRNNKKRNKKVKSHKPSITTHHTAKVAATGRQFSMDGCSSETSI